MNNRHKCVLKGEVNLLVDLYKPIVPKWVAEILENKQKGLIHPYCGRRKEWDDWECRYSRKLKYARLNGWIVEGE
jgi:hypothetical protein